MTENNKILDIEFIKSLGETIGKIVDDDEVDEAVRFYRELEAACFRNQAVLDANGKIKGIYRKYILILKYITLPRLKEDEILSMLKTELIVTTEMNSFDLYAKIKEKVGKMDSVEEANIFREKAQGRILTNNELITDENIVLSGVGAMPTVANWLRDYRAMCGLKNIDLTCLEKYLLNNVNIKSLPSEKVVKVKSILNLYENLKTPFKESDLLGLGITVSLPDGSLGIYRGGQLEKIVSAEGEKKGMSKDSGQTYKLSEQEKRAIEASISGDGLDGDEEPAIIPDINERKKEMLEYIESKLFKNEYAHPSIENAANTLIISILIKEIRFKVELERALYQNNERLTHKKFILDNREQEPSIRNWLRCFIEEMGSGIFNNLELTKFISESKNAVVLDDDEKKLLSKLLHTYRNIKFFPQSMGDLAPEKWEIIPVEKEEPTSRVVKMEKNTFSGREALIKELKGSIDDYAPGSLEREILEEESEKDREYHKLLLLMKKYPEGSLERRAVEDEIKKLEN